MFPENNYGLFCSVITFFILNIMKTLTLCNVTNIIIYFKFRENMKLSAM